MNKMKMQDFEYNVKSVLQNDVESIDVDALIKSIHGEDKRKPKAIWWLGLLAIVSVLSVIGFGYIQQQKEPYIDQEADIQYLAASKKTKSPQNETDLKTAPLQQESNDHTSSIEKTTSTPIDESVNTNPVSPLQKTSSPFNITKTPSASAVTNTNTTAYNEYRASSSTASYSTSKKTTTETGLSSNTQTHNVNRATIQLLENIENTKVEQLTALSGASNRDLPKVSYTECPTFSNKLKFEFDIIPEIGYIVPIKNLSTENQSDVFTTRTQTEKPLEALQAGLYGRLRAKGKPYYLKIGASYTRLSERTLLEYTEIERDTTVGIISITESQNGDTLTVIRGDIVTETEITHKSTDHYFLKYIDIPVAIGYSQSVGNGWRLGAELGAQFNISLATSGKFLETPTEYTELPAEGTFRNSLGMSYFGGLMIEKSVGIGAFYVSPRFRYFPSKISAEGYSIEQKYQFAGLHAGYIFTF